MSMIPDEILGVYERNKKQFVSILRAAVLSEAQFTVVPEVLDVLGDQAVKFLEIFSGRGISVPPIKSIVEKMRQVSVWVALGVAKDQGCDEADAVAQVAATLHIRQIDVRNINETMSDLMDHLSMELRPTNGEKEESSQA